MSYDRTKDQHYRVVSKVLEIPIDKVTKEMRAWCKAATFGCLTEEAAEDVFRIAMKFVDLKAEKEKQ